VGRAAPEILSAIRVAQRKVEVDPYLLLAIAWKESSFDPKARNKHSSAQGLLQFTTTTWLTVIRDFGARHGLAHYAKAIAMDRDGRLMVKPPRLRRAILALRDDPRLQAIMTAERLAQERRSLEEHIDRPAGAADLYFVHLLGPTGAKRFLTQLAKAPDSSSIAAVGNVASPNAGLFIKNDRPLSVAEAYAGIQTALNEQAVHHAGALQPEDGFMANTQ